MRLDIRVGSIDDIVIIDKGIPEFSRINNHEDISCRIADKVNLVLVAFNDNRAVGYKIGYALPKKRFYSWLGGVIPEYRNQGIATKLREAQETWAIENGYTSISVKSMNQFPAMLQLLISSGYQITGYEDNGSPYNSKIKFSKSLIT